MGQVTQLKMLMCSNRVCDIVFVMQKVLKRLIPLLIMLIFLFVGCEKVEHFEISDVIILTTSDNAPIMFNYIIDYKVYGYNERERINKLEWKIESLIIPEFVDFINEQVSGFSKSEMITSNKILNGMNTKVESHLNKIASEYHFRVKKVTITVK